MRERRKEETTEIETRNLRNSIKISFLVLFLLLLKLGPAPPPT